MQNLIALYQKRLNLQNASFFPIEHEDAMVAMVYKVTLAPGKELILKICSRTGDYLREAYFLEYFTGKIPVPRIIQLVPPETGIHGAILMECLPGALLKIMDLNGKMAYEIGEVLAKIHLNPVQGYGDLTQPDDLSSDPRIHFTMKFQEGLEECTNHLPNTLMEKCCRYYDRHIDLLTSVDGPCIIHRDFRPGNIMVLEGQLQGIFDWSSGRGGFAEEDFSPMELGEWSQDFTYKSSFLAGYASIRPIPHYHDIMPLLRLSRAIAVIGFTVKRGTWETTHTKIYQINREFLETFLK